MRKLRNFLVPKEEVYFCQKCGRKVRGGRYNNHCPGCLWSKHVDSMVPGDRAAGCGGLMEPVEVVQKEGRWRVVHRCLGCGKVTVNDVADGDCFDLIIRLASRPARRIGGGQNRSDNKSRDFIGRKQQRGRRYGGLMVD